MNKKLILNERGMKQINDSAIIKGTRVICKVPGTDEVLWELTNKVLAPGSAYVANSHFDFGENKPPVPVTPSYNEALGIIDPDPTLVTPPPGAKKIYLFGVGTDGCAETGVQQYEVDYTKWAAPDTLVPFRYTDERITGVEQRNRYCGEVERTDIFGTPRFAYYFKTFDKDPVWIQRYIGSNADIVTMYDNDITTPMESYVELKLSVTSAECREWFKYTKNSGNPYVNTITLLQGWKISDNLFYHYKDLHPVTKLNFPTETLREETKGLEITYHIFY